LLVVICCKKRQTEGSYKTIIAPNNKQQQATHTMFKMLLHSIKLNMNKTEELPDNASVPSNVAIPRAPGNASGFLSIVLEAKSRDSEHESAELGVCFADGTVAVITMGPVISVNWLGDATD
jgi:hypothetical protein